MALPIFAITLFVSAFLLFLVQPMIGKMIRLNGQGHTVIGVMAPGVEFPRGAGLWIPLGIDQQIIERRGATFLQAIARTNLAPIIVFELLCRRHDVRHPPGTG